MDLQLQTQVIEQAKIKHLNHNQSSEQIPKINPSMANEQGKMKLIENNQKYKVNENFQSLLQKNLNDQTKQAIKERINFLNQKSQLPGSSNINLAQANHLKRQSETFNSSKLQPQNQSQSHSFIQEINDFQRDSNNNKLSQEETRTLSSSSKQSQSEQNQQLKKPQERLTFQPNLKKQQQNLDNQQQKLKLDNQNKEKIKKAKIYIEVNGNHEIDKEKKILNFQKEEQKNKEKLIQNLEQNIITPKASLNGKNQFKQEEKSSYQLKNNSELNQTQNSQQSYQSKNIQDKGQIPENQSQMQKKTKQQHQKNPYKLQDGQNQFYSKQKFQSSRVQSELQIKQQQFQQYLKKQNKVQYQDKSSSKERQQKTVNNLIKPKNSKNSSPQNHNQAINVMLMQTFSQNFNQTKKNYQLRPNSSEKNTQNNLKNTEFSLKQYFATGNTNNKQNKKRDSLRESSPQILQKNIQNYFIQENQQNNNNINNNKNFKQIQVASLTAQNFFNPNSKPIFQLDKAKNINNNINNNYKMKTEISQSFKKEGNSLISCNNLEGYDNNQQNQNSQDLKVRLLNQKNIEKQNQTKTSNEKFLKSSDSQLKEQLDKQYGLLNNNLVKQNIKQGNFNKNTKDLGSQSEFLKDQLQQKFQKEFFNSVKHTPQQIEKQLQEAYQSKPMSNTFSGSFFSKHNKDQEKQINQLNYEEKNKNFKQQNSDYYKNTNSTNKSDKNKQISFINNQQIQQLNKEKLLKKFAKINENNTNKNSNNNISKNVENKKNNKKVSFQQQNISQEQKVNSKQFLSQNQTPRVNQEMLEACQNNSQRNFSKIQQQQFQTVKSNFSQTNEFLNQVQKLSIEEQNLDKNDLLKNEEDLILLQQKAEENQNQNQMKVNNSKQNNESVQKIDNSEKLNEINDISDDFLSPQEENTRNNLFYLDDLNKSNHLENKEQLYQNKQSVDNSQEFEQISYQKQKEYQLLQQQKQEKLQLQQKDLLIQNEIELNIQKKQQNQQQEKRNIFSQNQNKNMDKPADLSKVKIYGPAVKF
ncbi:hypothetical protein PPERSA_01273 [Pseudocohnilembus persalinus]|uniref:Uncharacterized protein n=1 Tax=Pseudocohnilembus persalinus TaxID=266149 RepID=A0A0V0QGW9_PSEPJ|nr:hypothetical protein PPERSA_01273 [Pseudocohnilembus persalinus]|eukprot:KRX01370.1 hypothetical protein PPERSA_01273 [Pseudocohnilembus persalinus]